MTYLLTDGSGRYLSSHGTVVCLDERWTLELCLHFVGQLRCVGERVNRECSLNGNGFITTQTRKCRKK